MLGFIIPLTRHTVWKVDYYSDLTKADLTSTVLVTAYRRWRNCFLKGIKQRTLEDLNDDREISGITRV